MRWARSTTLCRGKEESVPALFALGQHEALQAVARVLLPSEKLFAFLYDIFIVAAPERLAFCTDRWRRHCGTTHECESTKGKTRMWNRAGVFPLGCEHIVEAGRRAVPQWWCGGASSRCRRVIRSSASWEPSRTRRPRRSRGSQHERGTLPPF